MDFKSYLREEHDAEVQRQRRMTLRALQRRASNDLQKLYTYVVDMFGAEFLSKACFFIDMTFELWALDIDKQHFVCKDGKVWWTPACERCGKRASNVNWVENPTAAKLADEMEELRFCFACAGATYRGFFTAER